MNKYQEALSNIGGIVLEPSNDGYHDPRTVCQFFVEDIVILHELVNIYPEYLELKAKATPKKPAGYHTDYNCPTCNKRVRSGKGSSSRIKDTVCRNCYQVLDWGKE